MFYSERKRLKEIAEKESRGEVLWTNKVPAALRYKITMLVEVVEERNSRGRRFDDKANILGVARDLLAMDIGQPYLSLSGVAASADMNYFITNCDNAEFPDALEALYTAVRATNNIADSPSAEERFARAVNKLLESYRVNYSLEGKEVILFESRELHVEVIVPTLRLLTSPGWETVEKPYQEALKEVSDGNPADAITDVTTALQEGLRKVGCTGKNLNNLIKSAKSDVLKGFDTKYISAIELLVNWSSAARTQKGDSHMTVETEKEYAWFVIHTIGTLLLHLSKLEK